MNADLEGVQDQTLRVGDSDPLKKMNADLEGVQDQALRVGDSDPLKKMNADLEGVQEQALRVGDSDPVEKNERWPRRSTRPDTTGWWQWSSGKKWTLT